MEGPSPAPVVQTETVTVLPPKLGDCDQHRLQLATTGDIEADRELAIHELGDCGAKVRAADAWRAKHSGG